MINLRIPRFENPAYIVAGGMTDFRKRYPERNAAELCADAGVQAPGQLLRVLTRPLAARGESSASHRDEQSVVHVGVGQGKGQKRENEPLGDVLRFDHIRRADKPSA
jgi:hypothetical protein